ncbi:MAG: hypothetical protein QOJ93_3533 [Actinomycetota bacterium]|nr:hypothetical protein [Actinomycetota bacterium]
MLPCRVIALNLHRTAAAAAVGMLVLAGACASPLKPVVAPASPMSATPAPVPSAVPAPQATTSQPKPTTRPAAARCPTTLASELARTAGAAQLITVTAPAPGATSASISLWQRSGGCWSLVAGPWPARVGGTGVSDHHREGDGSTPAGLYGIGPVMYGLAADPGVRYAYHRLACGDWWDEDSASPTYNTFQHVACNATPPFKGKSEALWQATTAYQHFAVVDYNAHPVIPGAGSAVFLHDDTGRPTIGCVSVASASLIRLLQWLDPSQSPAIAIGTEAEIRRF